MEIEKEVGNKRHNSENKEKKEEKRRVLMENGKIGSILREEEDSKKRE